MLRAMAVKDATLAIVPEPLVIFHEFGSAGRVSKKADWRFQFEWLERNRATVYAPSLFLLRRDGVH